MANFLRLMLVLGHAAAFLPARKLPLWLWPLLPLLRLFGFQRGQMSAAVRKRKAEKIGAYLVRLGAPYIKIGQFLALRSEIISPALTQALSELHANVPPFSQQEAVRIVEKTLSSPIEQIFSTFSGPVSAASIAQVHMAQLRASGEKVAVKVVRPTLRKECEKAFRLIRMLVRVGEFFFTHVRSMNLRQAFRELERSLHLEMDMRMEAAAMSAIDRNAKASATSLACPKVVWECTGANVLTMSWVEGVPLAKMPEAEFLAMGLNRDSRKGLAQQLVQAFFIQVLDHGFFHADLHPGNLFVTPQGKLVAIDFGLMGYLNLELRLFLSKVMMGFIQRDYAKVSAAYVAYNYIPPERGDEFTQALYFIGEPIVGKRSKDISFGKLIEDLLHLMRQFKIPLHPELLLLHKSVITVESMARRLDNEHNFWASSEPVIREWIQKTFSLKQQARRFLEEVRHTGKLWQHVPLTLKHIERQQKRLVFLHAQQSRRQGWLIISVGVLTFILGFACSTLI